MPDMIKDGTGNGYGTKVDENNMLHTYALNIPRLLWHSLNEEDVFTTYNKHTIQVDDTEEKVCYLEYTGSGNLIINKLMISCNDATNSCKFEVYVNATTLAGGVAVVPTNWNRTSDNTINTVTKHTNSGATPITTASDGNEIICLYSKPGEGLVEISLDGLVLGKSDNILVIAENKAGQKVRVTIHYYED
jgi:hypothetical protein